MKKKSSVGLVFGSGGLKSFAAIALLELLEQKKKKPELLIGCSGGAIIAAIYGMGYSAHEIEKLVSMVVTKDIFRFNRYAMLGMAHLPVIGKFDYSSGIVKQEPILNTLRQIFKDKRIEDLEIDCRLQATDLETGESVALVKGPVAEAVYASCALFPILPPICIDGRWLGDGWSTSPLPIIEVIKSQVDVVIGVVFEESIVKKPKNFLEILHNHLNILKTSLTRAQTCIAVDMHHDEVFIINMKFNKIDVWDVDQIQNIINRGRETICEKREYILSGIDKICAN